MVVVNGPSDDAAALAAVADDIFSGLDDLQSFFDQAGLDVAAGAGGETAEQEEELEWLSNKDAFPAVETMAPRTDGVRRRRRAVAWATGKRWCWRCGARNTPQQHDGPEGRGTLCNACGARDRKGRVVPVYRPLNSSAFSPELHSNKHPGGVEAAEEGDEEELENLSNKDASPAVAPRAKGVRRPQRTWSPPPQTAAATAKVPRWCRHCLTKETPQWREGPEGRGTLCNACGVRYRSGRLVPEYRPLNSPTFYPELHSNKHRQIVQMRLCQGPSIVWSQCHRSSPPATKQRRRHSTQSRDREQRHVISGGGEGGGPCNLCHFGD